MRFPGTSPWTISVTLQFSFFASTLSEWGSISCSTRVSSSKIKNGAQDGKSKKKPKKINIQKIASTIVGLKTYEVRIDDKKM